MTDRRLILGIPFDPITSDETLARLRAALAEGRGGVMVNPNVDVLRQAVADPAVGRLVIDADLVLVDGAPVHWVSRLSRSQALPERIPGASFIWRICAEAADQGWPVFLLGGNPGVAETAAAVFQAEYPALKVAGTYCPPFGFEQDEAQLRAIEDAVEQARPRIVFTALGFPKQERLMHRLAGRFPDMWFIGEGAALSFVAGDVARAPEWMQRLGIEWLHRLVTEPRRLFKRYIVHDLPFVARMLVWALRERRRTTSIPV